MPRFARLRVLLIASFVLFTSGSSSFALESGGSTVLEVSSRLSKDLKTRIQEHLDRIFGFGRSEVFVQVDVGFSKEIRSEFEKTLRAFLSGEMSRASVQAQMGQIQAQIQAQVQDQVKQGGYTPPSPGYQWLFPGLANEAGGGTPGQAQSYILPGFTMQSVGGAGSPAAPAAPAAPAPSGYSGGPQQIMAFPFSDPNFLYAIGLEIKRIFVKVAIDQSLPSDSETKVQALLAALLEIDPERGDRVLITRFQIPNPIFELFKDPKFLGVVLQWATIAVLILLGLSCLTLLGLLALRGMIGFFEQIAQAFVVARNRSLELKFDLPLWLRESLPMIRLKKVEEVEQHSSVTSRQGEEGGGAMATAGGGVGGGASGPPRDLTIRIPADKAADLCHLIGKEDPKHIALVVAKLPSDTRSAFLSNLAPEKLSDVLTAMANPQYVESDMMMHLKEELERRVVGVVGGEHAILQTLESLHLMMRMKLLHNLEVQNAALFKVVRKKILLFEDLIHVPEQELNVLLSKVPIQELTIAIADGITPPALKEKILRALPKKTAATLTELLSMAGHPPEDKILEAQDKILRMAQKMIADGSMRHPLAEPALEAIK